MSMDDPGWGEEVPDEPSVAPGQSKKAAVSGSGGIFQPNRNQLIIGGAVVVIIIVVLAVVLSGGKKSNNATTTTATTATVPASTTPTTSAAEAVAKAGTAYLALETPAYNSLTAFGSQVSGWSANPPTATAAQTAANPTIIEFKNFSTKLLAGTWPTAVQPQINTLASQVEVVANDLGGLGLAFTNNNQTGWSTTFQTDGNQLVTDVNAVRSVLKLPALATS